MNQMMKVALSVGSSIALQACCMGSGEAVVTPPVVGGAAVVAPAMPSAPVPALVLGAPAVSVPVPALPGYTFAVAAPGEYQIDARGGSMDAQLWLFSSGSVLTQDSDSGDGVDARIVSFLDPGSYEIHVGEWQSRDLDAQVSVTQLQPMTPVATIAPGAPPAIVNAPTGDSARAASVEIALTIAAPGNYRIDVVSPDSSVDPELQFIQNGALLQADSDSGEGTNAQVVRQLTPGTYTIRVRDWINRTAQLTVSATPA